MTHEVMVASVFMNILAARLVLFSSTYPISYPLLNYGHLAVHVLARKMFK